MSATIRGMAATCAKIILRMPKHGFNLLIGWWQLFRKIGTFARVIFQKLVSWIGLLRVWIGCLFRVKEFGCATQMEWDQSWRVGRRTEALPFTSSLDPKLPQWINGAYSCHYAWANGLSIFMRTCIEVPFW